MGPKVVHRLSRIRILSFGGRFLQQRARAPNNRACCEGIYFQTFGPLNQQYAICLNGCFI